jgi:hypothetical protein
MGVSDWRGAVGGCMARLRVNDRANPISLDSTTVARPPGAAPRHWNCGDALPGAHGFVIGGSSRELLEPAGDGPGPG